MSLAAAASPPPVTLRVGRVSYEQMEEDLEDEISSIRAQIHKLTQRRRLISSTLLGSSKIQKQLKRIDPSAAPVITESQLDNQENIHRLALSVTSFPYTDPSPESSNLALLGIRIDICGRTGKYDLPYYLHLKRKQLNDPGTEVDELSVYRHTIPAHIPLRNYESQYLPQRDEGYCSEVSSDSANGNKQDLHTLVRKVRRDLVSWTLRREAIEALAEKLGLVPETSSDVDPDESDEYASFVAPVNLSDQSVFRSVAATAVEARFVRVVWANGWVARVKITDKGLVERAVVFGEVAGEDHRIKSAENVLVGDGWVTVEELAKRLKQC